MAVKNETSPGFRLLSQPNPGRREIVAASWQLPAVGAVRGDVIPGGTPHRGVVAVMVTAGTGATRVVTTAVGITATGITAVGTAGVDTTGSRLTTGRAAAVVTARHRLITARLIATWLIAAPTPLTRFGLFRDHHSHRGQNGGQGGEFSKH